MITTERLAESIKQGTTIWRKSFTNKIFPLKLAERNSHISMPDMRLWVGSDCFDINDLYETKDKAEWALKTVAERTERFEPPMWEEIKDDFVFKFLVNGCLFRFYVDKDFCDIFGQLDGDDCYLVSKPATKENYEKACEVVRDLFKEKK